MKAKFQNLLTWSLKASASSLVLSLFLLSSCATDAPLVDFSKPITSHDGLIAFSTNENRDNDIDIFVHNVGQDKNYDFTLTPPPSDTIFFVAVGNLLLFQAPIGKVRAPQLYYFFELPAGTYTSSNFDSKLHILAFGSGMISWQYGQVQFVVKPNTVTYLGNFKITTGNFPFFKPYMRTEDDYADFLKFGDNWTKKPLDQYEKMDGYVTIKEDRTIFDVAKSDKPAK